MSAAHYQAHPSPSLQAPLPRQSKAVTVGRLKGGCGDGGQGWPRLLLWAAFGSADGCGGLSWAVPHHQPHSLLCPLEAKFSEQETPPSRGQPQRFPMSGRTEEGVESFCTKALVQLEHVPGYEAAQQPALLGWLFSRVTAL